MHKEDLILILFFFAILLWSSVVLSCDYYCRKQGGSVVSIPSRAYITDKDRRVVGDVYNPGPGRRVQIRDKHRRVKWYIDKNGNITDKHRRVRGNINDR